MDMGGQFHRHVYAAHATDGAKKKVLTSPWSPWASNGGVIKHTGNKMKPTKGRSTRAMGREERDHWSEDTVKRNLKRGCRCRRMGWGRWWICRRGRQSRRASRPEK
jgi:hypothetical protein